MSSADSGSSVEIIINQRNTLPIGLGAPPGLSLPPRPISSFDFDSDEFEARAESVVSVDGSEFANGITESMKAVSLNDSSDSSPASAKPAVNLWADYDDSPDADRNETKKEEKLWEGGQPKRPTDWDKIICPVHKVKCSATCEIVSKIKAEQKRELAKKTGGVDGDGDGDWREAKTKGRRESPATFVPCWTEENAFVGGQARSNGGGWGSNANGGRRGGWH